jgi:hypothetical protein
MTSCVELLDACGLSIYDADQLKRQFRKWALKNHPDKGGNSNKFKKVSSCKDDVLRLMEEAANDDAPKRASTRSPAKKPSPAKKTPAAKKASAAKKPAQKKPATKKPSAAKKPAKKKPTAAGKQPCGRCTGETLLGKRCKSLVSCRKGLTSKCWRHTAKK